jgi:hypothetical protein
MMFRGKNMAVLKNNLIMLSVILAICVLRPSETLNIASSATGTPHKVHIAFGFHVNLYHSFRGDTNDENGFGQDIRVIRHILNTLAQFENKGIPVGAVWDFDNLFSLQEILPAHAPDIIRNVGRRVKEKKDDVILMSYNNGLASAMNHREFMASLQRAVSNAHGSGVCDLFGQVAPIVRPQEMMTTPGHFARYQKLGIPYIAMYYSATAFDGFRLFSRALTPAEAHNPLQYRHPETGEKIIIIPTYHAGDLVEHVSLKNWAEKLHQLQNEGKIDGDVLLFLNFDADSVFWTGVDLPWHLKWLPNTGGLRQLIDSVADLDFVVFSKLTDYLAHHLPKGTVQFHQDTADGSFHGYHSWAEKACVSNYWTRIMRNRRAHAMVRKTLSTIGSNDISPDFADLLQHSFDTRLRALSTTNFGLAGPFLTRQREDAMASLLQRLDEYTARINATLAAAVEAFIEKAPPPRVPRPPGQLLHAFVYLNQDVANARAGDARLMFTRPLAETRQSSYIISDAEGQVIPNMMSKETRPSDAYNMSVILRVSKQHAMADGLYFLYRHAKPSNPPFSKNHTVFADTRVLRNEHINVNFDSNGHITGVTWDGRAQLEKESLMPYMRYRGRRWSPEHLAVTVEKTGEDGVAAVRISGRWDGPPNIVRAPGWINYRLQLIRNIPYLFIDGEVRYPDTYRHTVTNPEKPMLARKIDTGWEAVAPVELRFAKRASQQQPFFIHKRNYLGVEDAYAVDYFRHAPENRNVASINNHITSEYVGVTTCGQGMAVAMNTDVNANFAFCPFKMESLPETGEFRIQANPFGTYFGDQILPPTGGNRLGQQAVLLSGPQFCSAGPTYNGHRESFNLMLAFFNGDTIPEVVKQDLIAFARPPMVLGTHQMIVLPDHFVSNLPPAGFLAMPYQTGILFHWERTQVPDATYRIHFRMLPESKEIVFTAANTTLQVELPNFAAGRSSNRHYAAAIEAQYPDGRISKRSPEIQFDLTPPKNFQPDIPSTFKARVVWANVNAWLQRHLF